MKTNTNKRILALMLSIFMVLVSTSQVMLVSAADKAGVVIQKSDLMTGENPYDQVPRTFEAWIKLDGTGGARMILSDLKTGVNCCACFAVKEAGERVVNLYYRDNDNTAYRVIFDAEKGKIEYGTWTHIAATLDTDKAVFYINGTEVQTVQNDTVTALNTAISNKKFTFLNTPVIGGDHRNNNEAYWQGSIASVAAYSDVRTAEEIAADMTSYGTQDNVMLIYDLDKWNKVSDIPDNATGRYDVERTVTKTGITFTAGDKYSAKSKYETVPRTYEAWVNLPSGKSGARMILSDMASGQVCACFGLNDAATGKMNLYLRDDDNNQYRFIFDKEEAFLEFNEWTHIAATIGEESVKFYKDGVLVQTLNETNPAKDAEKGTLAQLNASINGNNFTFPNTPTVGGDHRNGNTSYWEGSISSVATYSDVRTADEIYADMASYGTEGLMLKYDLGAWDGDSIISDNVSGRYDIPFLWISPSDMPQRDPNSYAFSIAVVGDTQYLAKYDALNSETTLKDLYKWIVDNKNEKKTELVMGLGDIVDDAWNQAQWTVAKDAFKVMDGEIDYTLIPGNHDHADPAENGDPIAYFTDKGYDYHITYDTYGRMVDGYYPETITNQRYVDENNQRSEKEFSTDATMRNTYKLLKIGDLDYLILNLDYSPTDDALEWANGVVAEHPDHRVIVNTHCYLAISGDELVDSAENGTGKADGTSGWHNPINAGDAKDGNEGPEIWNKLIKNHANIEYVFCGHEPSNDILKYTQTGVNGNTVTTMLIDPQYFDRDTDASGCVGMVAMIYFSNDGKTIDVEYYSTVKNAYYNTKNQFRLGETAFADIETYDYSVTQSNITTTVYAVNESGAEKTGTLVAALYCDEVLLEAQIHNVDVAKGATQPIPITFGAHSDKTGKFTIKAFWWDGLGKMNPQSTVENASVTK